MSAIIQFIKKLALAALVLTVGLASLPASSASAACLQDETTPPANQSVYGMIPVPAQDNARLEQIWARKQLTYLRQGDRLAKSGELLTRAQLLIDRANQKGWNTSAVQAALNAFAAVIPAAQAAHDLGAAIIASHYGFDANGTVTDRAEAVESVKALAQVLKNTRAAMNSTGLALREAVKAFRDAHKPTQPPASQ